MNPGTSGTVSSESAVINVGAFVRALIVPILAWGSTVFLVAAAGQPGVVCITPVAWLLALWSGGQYIRFSKGHPGRWPLLGPALTGAALGLGMGILFFIVSRQMMAGDSADDIAKGRVLTVIIGAAGVIVCAALSMLTAQLTLRRLAREQGALRTN